MKELKTKPGVTYVIECPEAFVLTNGETGNVVLEGDGSGQVYFTATGEVYLLSSDEGVAQALPC